MKSFVVFCIIASALKVDADVTVSVPTVMCNCAAPNGANYAAFNDAVAQCSAYPSGGAGFASCVTNVLGFLSADGRSADFKGLSAMYGDVAANCAGDAVMAASFAAEAWTWPGTFDFNGLDSALNAFYDCANAAAVVACENELRSSLASCAA